MKKFYFVLFFLLVAFCAPTFSAYATDSQTNVNITTTDTSAATVILPDYSSAAVMVEVERFKQGREDLERGIHNLSILDPVQFDDIEKRLNKRVAKFVRLRSLSSWDLRAVTDFKAKVQTLFDDSEKIKSDYVEFLKTTDGLLGELENKKTYFQIYLEKIKMDASLETQRLQVKATIVAINVGESDIKKARETFTATYQAHADLLNRVLNFSQDLDQEILYFRDAHFKKNAPAFFEHDFVESFQGGSWAELRVSWLNVLDIDDEWLNANRGKAWGFIAVVLVLFLFFRRLKARPSLGEIFQQPLGLAFTTAVVLAGFYVPQSMQILLFAYWLILSAMLVIVMRSYPLTKRQKQDINVLVVCYGILQIVDAIGMPLPLYRVFLVLLALVLGIYCYLRTRCLKRAMVRSPYLQLVFRGLIVLFNLSVLAELLGYHSLAAFLLRGTIKSSFLVFVVWNLRFLFIHLITSLIQDIFDRIHLARRDRHVIFKKIRSLFHILLVAFVLLTLTTIWGFYDTIFSAWTEITAFGVNWGKAQLTIGMVVDAAFLMYLAASFAEIICSLLAEEVYPRNNIVKGTGQSINSLITYFVWVVGFFLASLTIGIRLKQFAIIAGALSVGIGFGLQNIVNNFVSGLILLFERPIKVGDILDINGRWGTVEKMGLRSTIIRSGAKTQIIIPNSDFVTQKVENVTFSDSEYCITIKVDVAYGSDTAKVQRILIAVAAAQEHVKNDPMPAAYFTEFGENALHFEVVVWIDDVTKKKIVTSVILLAIDQKFREEGVEIPFPQRILHVKTVDAELFKKS